MVPVVAFHSAEKGHFASWLVKTDGEEFDLQKLAFASVETPVGSFVEAVFYDGVLLECESDGMESTGKGYYACAGWLDLRERVEPRDVPAEAWAELAATA